MSQVHIIEPDAFVRGSLVRAAQQVPEISLGTVDHRWLALHEDGLSGDVVILRARMFDIWPIILKTAALTRLGCRVIVLMDPPRHEAAARLREAGAWAIDSDGDLAGPDAVIQLAQQALHNTAPADAAGKPLLESADAPSSEQEAPPAPVWLADLLDRPLQVACLYASAPAPSAREIGRVLGIAESTVRGHLDRVRASYRRVGIDLPDRARMRAQLRTDGLRIGESGWL